jgi:hypothetical protein
LTPAQADADFDWNVQVDSTVVRRTNAPPGPKMAQRE